MDKAKKRGRNLLLFKNSEDIRVLLYVIGKSYPSLRVKEFIQAIRYDDTRDERTGKHRTKMSYEYKILNKSLPSLLRQKCGPGSA